jgi:diadenosine tetraphosphate (Ap4A) HIT family hydrolase
VVLFRCTGGDVVLPNRKLVLVSREDGGNLIVNPPREVWERSELAPEELAHWCFLVSATGRAMIETLPQLDGGCVNYWDAGNWALNVDAEPQGAKTGSVHRRVHMHLLGRSRTARHPAWQWGEAPVFPKFKDRFAWAADFQRLTAQECREVIAHAETLLRTRFGMRAKEITPRVDCASCGYPTVEGNRDRLCPECAGAGGMRQ